MLGLILPTAKSFRNQQHKCLLSDLSCHLGCLLCTFWTGHWFHYPLFLYASTMQVPNTSRISCLYIKSLWYLPGSSCKACLINPILSKAQYLLLQPLLMDRESFWSIIGISQVFDNESSVASELCRLSFVFPFAGFVASLHFNMQLLGCILSDVSSSGFFPPPSSCLFNWIFMIASEFPPSEQMRQFLLQALTC